MSEIICECGHGIEEHRILSHGCTHDMGIGQLPDGNYHKLCDCNLTPQAVEARYVARRAHKRYNQLLDENYRLSNNCDALQAKLDVAMKAIEKASDPYIRESAERIRILDNAKTEIAKLGGEEE